MKHLRKLFFLLLVITIIFVGCGSGDVGTDSAGNPIPSQIDPDPEPSTTDPSPEPSPESDEEKSSLIEINGINIFIDGEEIDYIDSNDLKSVLTDKLSNQENVVLADDNGDRNFTKEVRSILNELDITVEEKNNEKKSES